jgi:hypothetical protein
MKTAFRATIWICFLSIFTISCLLIYNHIFHSDYVMKLEFDEKDILDINAFYIKKHEQKEATINREKNEIRIKSKDTKNLGGLKIEFKSKTHGVLEYTDHPIDPGRKLIVTCSDGKIVIAVHNAGFL